MMCIEIFRKTLKFEYYEQIMLFKMRVLKEVNTIEKPNNNHIMYLERE